MTQFVAFIAKADVWKAYAVVLSMPPSENAAYTDWIKKHWQSVPSVFFYEAGNRLFASGRSGEKDQALNWYLLGRLRVLQDLEACRADLKDESIILLDKFSEPLVRYRVTQRDATKKAWAWAFERDAEAGRRPHPKWNCLVAVNLAAFTLGKATLDRPPGTVPKEEWPALREKIRKAVAAALETKGY